MAVPGRAGGLRPEFFGVPEAIRSFISIDALDLGGRWVTRPRRTLALFEPVVGLELG
ncbi:MAG: hypothetical protein KC502_08390 [Myxococcales bacterium]|nr:hypothetical protein [Myxococcales bacterium]